MNIDGKINRRFIHKTDFLFFASIMLVAALIYALQTDSIPGKAQILYNGEIIKTMNLLTDNEFEFTQNPDIRFKISDGGAAFIASDCHDLICVKTGFIRKTGQMAVCAPNRIILRIEGQGMYDAITY